jgi:uncharacterized membrane protein
MFDSFHQSQAFLKEIMQWADEGIISADQAQALIKKYALDQPAPWYRNSTFILKAAGIVLVALGILLFIAANWEAMPTPLRMLSGLLPWLACYGMVWKKSQENDEQGTELWLLASTLLLGANIALQAQIFHISAYFPDGVLWWIIGGVPVMLYFRSNALVVVLQILYVIWLFMQNDYQQFSVWSPFLFATFLYVLYTNTTALAALLFAPTLWAFCLNLVLAFGTKNSFDFFSYFYLFFATILGFYFYLLHYFEAKFSPTFFLRLKQSCYLVAIMGFFPLTTEGVCRELLEYRNIISLAYILLYTLLAAAVLLAVLKFEKKVSFVFSLLLLVVFYLMIWSNNGEETANFWAVFNTFLLFVYSAALIYEGIRLQQKTNFMAGLLYLMILALKLYLDLIKSYETTALIFILCGVGLYYANRLWDKKVT